jgi:hypothetical protein
MCNLRTCRVACLCQPTLIAAKKCCPEAVTGVVSRKLKMLPLAMFVCSLQLGMSSAISWNCSKAFDNPKSAVVCVKGIPYGSSN